MSEPWDACDGHKFREEWGRPNSKWHHRLRERIAIRIAPWLGPSS